MEQFLQTALSFPTLWWSVLFGFCIAYWLLASTGLLHHHHSPLDGGHGGADLHHGAHGHAHHGDSQDVTDSAGMLARLGLDGVPLTVMLTVLSFCCWLSCYYAQLYLISALPAQARAVPSLLALVGALVPGTLLTALLLRPFRAAFARLDSGERRSLIGQIGVVSTPEVTAHEGMARVDDGGAGLLLQVRTEGAALRRGQRVLLLSYQAADNSYLVVPADDLR